ncbi:MAG: ATP-binding protein [Chloroflexota bacterium]|nr:ATP-binding protein [Chloroflexota bacterium]
MDALSSQPTLVCLVGLPGTGKTTLAYAIARQLHWPVFDKDLINTVLLDTGMQQPDAGPLAYQLALALTDDFIIQQRQSIILDTAGRQPFILERATAIAQSGAARLKIIRCVAPYHIRMARLNTRIAKPSQWTTDQATDHDQEAWYAHVPPHALVLETTVLLENLVAHAVGFIQEEH